MLKSLSHYIRRLNHNRIDFLRQLRKDFLRLLINQKNPLSHERPRSDIKSIVVLRLDGKLGDTITITGLLDDLFNAGYQITIITREYQSFIYDYINTPITVLRISNLFSVLKVLFKLRSDKYHFLICTSHLLDPSSLLLARYIKSYEKTVFLNKEFGFFDHHVCENFNNVHITERYNLLLQSIGLKTKGFVFKYNLQSKSNLHELYQTDFKLIKQNKIIILNSFAGSSDRNLSQDLTEKIISEVLSVHQNHIVISIGSQSDYNNHLMKWKINFSKKFGQKWCLLSCGDFALNYLAVKNADLIITPDTAIIHLASALQKKIIGIYRVASNHDEYPVVWAPLRPADDFRIIYAHNGQIDNFDTKLIRLYSCELLQAKILD